MNKLIAHAVTASLALFTLSDGPADKAEAQASAPREPAKGASTARPDATAKPAATKPAAASAAVPARPAEQGKAAGTASASAPAKPADPKPCEPIKPCSID